MQVVLSLDCKSVTIEPDDAKGTDGCAIDGGEFPQGENADALRLAADEAFWLRHAVSSYAGSEAVRQLCPGADAEAGCGQDNDAAVDAINRITTDEESIDLLFRLAKRRTQLLVTYYRPEIAAVATLLDARRTISGEDVLVAVQGSLRDRDGSFVIF